MANGIQWKPMETKTAMELANRTQWNPMETKTPMEFTNGNQNPNGIGQWKLKPQFNHKKSNNLIIYQNSYPKFTCPMKTKTRINS